MIQAQTQTPFAIRGGTVLSAIALTLALGVSAAGGYAIGDASARAAQAGATRASEAAFPIQVGPALRWIDDKQPAAYSFPVGPALRWRDDKQPAGYPFQLGPAPRSTHEESVNGVPAQGD